MQQPAAPIEVRQRIPGRHPAGGQREPERDGSEHHQQRRQRGRGSCAAGAPARRRGGKLGRELARRTQSHLRAQLARPRSRRLAARLWRRRFALVYLACLCAFARQMVRFGDRHTGYSSLILFGDHFAPQRLPQLAPVPLYTYARQVGYDGQFYAQIAVAGNPFDRDLARALDAPAYRERRILLPLIVHIVGLGRPAVIIQLFALANLLCLALLAALLARWWFPPTDLDNLIRWAGIVFGAGLVVSTTRSLTDGPALLLIAIGARQLERGRTWAAAVVLGLAGLVRETSVLCAVAFWPRAIGRTGRTNLGGPAPRRAGHDRLRRADGRVDRDPVRPLRAHRRAAQRGPAVLRARQQGRASWATCGGRAASTRPLRDELLIAATLVVQIGFLIARPQPRQTLVANRRCRSPCSRRSSAGRCGRDFPRRRPGRCCRCRWPSTASCRARAGGSCCWLSATSASSPSPICSSTIVPTEQLAFADGIGARYEAGWMVPEHGRARHLALGLRHGDALARQSQRRPARGDARFPAALGRGPVGDGFGRNQPRNY